MKVFAISDLHLSLAKPKEMDIFGRHWKNHWTKICADWKKKVTEDDCVLIAGDISWAMHYNEAAVDFEAIRALPGHKIMIKGNHDYWHTSLRKTREMLGGGSCFLQFDAWRMSEFVFAGTRGWKQKGDAEYTEEDDKLYAREAGRLKMSLEASKKAGGEIIAMMHYPPFTLHGQGTAFTDLFSEYGVKTVVYGHIHSDPSRLQNGVSPDMTIGDTQYLLTSCDVLDFKLLRLR